MEQIFFLYKGPKNRRARRNTTTAYVSHDYCERLRSLDRAQPMYAKARLQPQAAIGIVENLWLVRVQESGPRIRYTELAPGV